MPGHLVERTLAERLLTARRIATVALTVTLLAFTAGIALAAPADLDPGFGRSGRLTLDDSHRVRALALQPDGKILVAGDALTGGMPTSEGVLYRLHPSGSLDPTFASTGAAALAPLEYGAAVGLQPDGKVLAAGYSQGNAAVVRRAPDGMPDRTFNGTGLVVIDSGGEDVRALALQPDGKILVAGGTNQSGSAGSDAVVYRLNPDGTPDDGFGSGGTSRIEGDANELTLALALQPDGKILVAGAAGDDEDTDAFVHRLNANGTLDESFGRNGTFEIDEGGRESAYALARQPDGKVLVVGPSEGRNVTADTFVYRLRADGTPDPAFGNVGSVSIDDGALTIGIAAALQRDGKLLVAGVSVEDADPDMAVYRLNTDGSRDSGFAADGVRLIDGDATEIAGAIAVQPDGKVILGGEATSGPTQRSLLYRLQGGDPVPLSPATPASPATAPVLGRLRITPSVFRAAGRGPAARPALRRRGASVSFTLDRAAGVRIAVARADRGRRVDGRCVKPRRSNRGKRRCTRHRVLRGGFTHQGRAGANRFRLPGRINARRLRPGRYRLIATPVADGRRGNTKHTAFRIKP